MPVPSLPNEIERMIFLLAPHNSVCACIMVAKRVQGWLEPGLYHAVCLQSERAGTKFLQCIQMRPEFAASKVKVLYLAIAVRVEVAAGILDICCGVEELTLRPPCHLFGVNPILRPLDALARLNSLSVDLSSIFNHCFMFLPNVPTFHRVTHLHISNAWASWPGSSIGIENLSQITHLSLYISTIRTRPSILWDIIARDNLKVLVLWRRPFVTYNEAQLFLESYGLVDRRIVVLNVNFLIYYMQDGGFWKYAARVIKWREQTNAGPFDYDTLLVLPPIQLPHEHDDYTYVETDVDSSNSSTEAEEEPDVESEE